MNKYALIDEIMDNVDDLPNNYFIRFTTICMKHDDRARYKLKNKEVK